MTEPDSSTNTGSTPRVRGRHRHAAVEEEAEDYTATNGSDDVDVETVTVGRHGRHTSAEAYATAPDVVAPDVVAPDLPAPDVVAPDVTAPDLTVADATSTAAEPPPAAPVSAASVSDDQDSGGPGDGGSASDEPKKSRAGRNLPAAIGVGLGLAAVVLGTLFIYRPSFLGVIIAAMSYGIYELTTALGKSDEHGEAAKIRAPLIPLLVGGVAMQVAAWQRGANGLVVSLLITVAAIIIWRLADGVEGYLRDVSGAVLVLAYVPLLAGFAVLLTRPDDGVARVITFVAIVVCSDTGGYAAGVLFGRHLLAPVVSKGKTWEGVAGSVVACCLCGGLIMSLTFHHAWWQGVLLGLSLVVTATLGDLGESLIKRDLGIKDMGSLLPGHGGLMDRLDSLLPCAAVTYLVLTAFLGR